MIIPARNEEFLIPTVADIYRQAAGDIEVIVCLDGWWPDSPIIEDPRLKILHWGAPQGMRACINAGADIATGEYLMKLDGHCCLAEGFDYFLKRECEDQEMVIPTKYSLDADQWCRAPKEPWNYFWMIWPWDPENPGNGLIARDYGRNMNERRKHETCGSRAP